MKPINGFLPRAISPLLVDAPSAKMSPFSTLSPTNTIGRWFIQLPWLLRANLITLYSSLWPSSLRTTIFVLVDLSTTPPFLAVMQTPESYAALDSIPVPTTGASVERSGTAWRCMLDPISARLASSFSRKGIMDVATENTIFGDTSIKSRFTLSNSDVSSRKRPDTWVFTKCPSSSTGSFACATT